MVHNLGIDPVLLHTNSLYCLCINVCDVRGSSTRPSASAMTITTTPKHRQIYAMLISYKYIYNFFIKTDGKTCAAPFHNANRLLSIGITMKSLSIQLQL